MKKYQRTLSTGVVILIGLLFATFWKGELNLGKTLKERRSTSAKVQKNLTPKTTKTIVKETSKVGKKQIPEKKAILVKGPKGDEDISETLARIKRGEKFPHHNDGRVFRNREKRLPQETRGYYHEFVHPTKGRRGPGAQRVVIGDEKEIFYTPDHYETFQRVKNVH